LPTQPKTIGYEHEADEAQEHSVDFLEPREEAAKPFESTEQALDLDSTLEHLAVVFPRLNALLQWWHHRNETQIQCKLPRLVAFLATVHQQMHRPADRLKTAEQAAPFRRVVRLVR